jgi:hypothetical protein
MAILTNEEKAAIINQHKRNVEYSKYGVELSIIEENAIQSPNQDTISSLNASLADLNSKLSALDDELASLS